MPRGVGASDDLREMLQGGIGEPILLQKGIEGAELTDVAELHARDVIGDGTGRLGDGQDLIGRHVEEFSVLVDEPFNQPRARDPVDFRTFSGNPLHDQTHLMAARRPAGCRERKRELDTVVSFGQVSDTRLYAPCVKARVRGTNHPGTRGSY